MSIVAKRKLSEYLKIHETRDERTISELAEAAAYFDSVGGQFTEKSQDIKKTLKNYTQTDMFKQIGTSVEDYSVNDSDYQLSEFKTTTKVVDEKGILALKGAAGIPDAYFKVTVNKELILKDYESGTLPTAMSSFVSVNSQMGLNIRKKPAKKGSKS